MKKIAIIHFSPVERYPPAINWLNFLAEHSAGEWQVQVFTTQPDTRFQQPFHPLKEFIKVRRFGVVRKEQRSFARYWNYLIFYVRTLCGLILWRPEIVLYYETLSALPAQIYKMFFRRRCALFVHYHEYISSQEYRESIPMNKWPHLLEKRNYSRCRWISHTNADRMRLFMNENRNIRMGRTHILPNYPPRSWGAVKEEEKDGVLKFVYVGAVDLTTMYTTELAEWIRGLEGKACWDIYSSNITLEARDFLSSLDSPYIRFMGSVEYASLPDILRSYDVGVVLYKGTTLNYRYNMPNKLFEYWACGLDVWFPEELESGLPLVTNGSYPRMVAMNFSELRYVDLRGATDRTGMTYVASPYYAEEVLPEMLREMKACSTEQR